MVLIVFTYSMFLKTSVYLFYTYFMTCKEREASYLEVSRYTVGWNECRRGRNFVMILLLNFTKQFLTKLPSELRDKILGFNKKQNNVDEQ